MTVKTLFFDEETTGVNDKENAIIQFAGIITYDGVEQERVDIHMQPHDTAVIEESALTKNGITLDEILTYQSAEKGFLQIQAFFDRHIDRYKRDDKFFVAGYNVKFDVDFLSALFKRFDQSKYGLGSYTNWRFIDPLSFINVLAWKGKLDLPNHQLTTVCAHYGIPLPNAHNAMDDTVAAKALIEKLFK